jgi:hypothetical protein
MIDETKDETKDKTIEKINMSIKFAKEIAIIKNALDLIQNKTQSERLEITNYLFKQICNMDEFISLNPGLRYNIVRKINEFSEYTELTLSIKNLKIFLEKIKYRDDYIVDILNGERNIKKIVIEI